VIRTLPLVCSRCGQKFTPKDIIYYKDDFTAKEIKDVKFVCQDCIQKWLDKWQIEDAQFQEKDYILTVSLKLKDGTTFEHLDCTPLDGTVVTGEDMPEAAQKKLFTFYEAWDLQRKAHTLKDCFFTDSFMKTTVTCTTYGGEEYKEMAFRFNMKGELETEKPVPDYIAKQIEEAYKLYKHQQEELGQ
jgi:DNA-directed RNA polymerase subunit RPC12/RpoP